jgi:hypothetical protein
MNSPSPVLRTPSPPVGERDRVRFPQKDLRIEPLNLTLVGGLLSNSSCPLAVPALPRHLMSGSARGERDGVRGPH